ncbi:hypothetical protein NMK71_08105 [Weeksellaceae bacterium KMM 9713]|uniref:Uncharacterized protein n=1 Tax=Profundicola chukchiensis TaxID=2961959 RepID=A0A9X4N3U9_9FLAO|nr:hypothetical protein [Profundicola chukchiensis]MDG4946374.1 hypothetical protein [Profundicola chukchiensis]
MTASKTIHNFHIPVMGLAFTIDSPIRVAQYGISSVISIIDDELAEKMNSFYSKKFNLPYVETPKKEQDHRAQRITNYLNLVDLIVKEKFEKFKCELAENKAALDNFIEMLPNSSDLRQGLSNMMDEGTLMKENILNYLETHLKPGEIDVNIMTKIDKDNYVKGEKLPIEFNDAHASLRGFAKSNLSSSLVLSAGMNPRLYSYFEQFEDFFPNEKNELKKKIILKVSDYRSAIIQGKFLAKKGLWVSEYRVESGLNCGGHAFATNGFLLGPILEEFKNKKEDLIAETHEILVKALEQKELPIPQEPLELKITVQGGVGTSDEHEFLINHYKVDSVGWGSPFLMVPEATSVDKETRTLLGKAKEEDLYLSGISPLGVPFNTVKGTSNEFFKNKRIAEGKAGSSCPKKFLTLNQEFGKEGICTAAKKFQDIKLKDLEAQKEDISTKAYKDTKFKITEKACLCVGLANAALMDHEIPIKGQDQGVVICPGPNIAYFDKEVSLKQMLKHIYGKISIMKDENRPNMFVKELNMYVDYLQKEIESYTEEVSTKQIKKWDAFKANIADGIAYYQELFSTPKTVENLTIQQQLLEAKEALMQVMYDEEYAI